MPHLLPTVKNEGFGSQAVEELPTSIPSQTKAEGGIVERLHARIGGINLSPTMLEENVDGDIESEGFLRSIEGDALCPNILGNPISTISPILKIW